MATSTNRVTQTLDDGRIMFGEPNPSLVKDPVCKMSLDPTSQNTEILEVNGRTYYFCSEACRNEFEENPEEFSDEP